MLQKELPIQDFDTEWTSTTNGRIYEVNLGGMPSGYSKQYVVVIHSDLVLLAGNEDSSQIKMLDHLDGTYVNITKFDLFQGRGNQESQGNHLYVWSQLPFMATEITSEVTWDGTHLKQFSQTKRDRTLEMLQRATATYQKLELRRSDEVG